MTRDITHPDLPGLPKGLPNTASEFLRPVWAKRPLSTSDSTPQVTTDELRRPAFGPNDSMPKIETADLPRPDWRRIA
jgi:hypothetical protein